MNKENKRKNIKFDYAYEELYLNFNSKLTWEQVKEIHLKDCLERESNELFNDKLGKLENKNHSEQLKQSNLKFSFDGN